MRAARLTAQEEQAGTGWIDADAGLWFGVLAVAFGSTLAYGGVTPAAQAALEVSSVILAVGLARRVVRQRTLPATALRLSLPLWSLAAVAVLQLLPVPVGLRAALGVAPEQALRFPLVAGWLPLSLNAASTLTAVRLLAAVAVLYVVFLVAINPRSAFSAAAWLISAGGVIAAGSIWSFIEPGTLFATVTGVGTDRARGPFVNPDHFGYWLAALIPLAAAGIMTLRRGGPPAMAYYRIASAAALPFLAAALGLTFSRGALLAVCCGLAYLALGVLRGDRLRRYGGAGIGVAVLTYAVWAAGATLAARFAVLWHDPLGDLRFAFWRGAFPAIAQAPLLGSGLGTFLEATRPFMNAPIPSRALVDHAHSEPLQLTVEVGVVGLLTALAGLVVWLRVLRTTRRQAATPGGSLLSCGAEAGVVTLLVGALFDFAIRLPAVGLLAAVLAALAVAAGGYSQGLRPIGRGAAVALAVGTIMLGGAFAAGVVAPYQAGQLAAQASLVVAADRTPAIEALASAARLQPRRGDYHYQLARQLAEAGYRGWTEGRDLHGLPLADDESRARVTQSLYVRAVNAYLDAIAADRTNPGFRRDLGWVMSNLATLEEAFATMPFTPELLLDRLPQDVEPSVLTLNLYQDAVGLEPRNAHLHYTLGLWALQQLVPEAGTGLGLAKSDRAPLEDVAAGALRRAVALDRALLAETVEAAVERGATYEDIRALVPAEALALWGLAQVLEGRGRTDWVDRLVGEITVGQAGSAVPVQAEELAESLARRPERAAARRGLESMRAAMPSSSRITGALARVDWRSGAYAEARREFADAIAGLPQSPARTALERDQGFMLIDAGDLAVAKEHFAKLLALRPADPWVQLGSGMVLDRQNLWLDASQAYQRARALAGHDDGIYFRLGLLYYQRGLYYQAVSAWEAGVDVYPNGPEMRLWLARGQVKNAKYDAAVQQYREALRLRPAYGEAQSELDALLAQDRR